MFVERLFNTHDNPVYIIGTQCFFTIKYFLLESLVLKRDELRFDAVGHTPFAIGTERGIKRLHNHFRRGFSGILLFCVVVSEAIGFFGVHILRTVFVAQLDRIDTIRKRGSSSILDSLREAFVGDKRKGCLSGFNLGSVCKFYIDFAERVGLGFFIYFLRLTMLDNPFEKPYGFHGNVGEPIDSENCSHCSAGENSWTFLHNVNNEIDYERAFFRRLCIELHTSLRSHLFLHGVEHCRERKKGRRKLLDINLVVVQRGSVIFNIKLLNRLNIIIGILLRLFHTDDCNGKHERGLYKTIEQTRERFYGRACNRY